MKYLRMKADEAAGNPTAEVIKAVLNQPPPGGFQVAEMRARLRIYGAVEKYLETAAEGGPTDSLLHLEDADAAVLRKCAEAAKWPSLHPGLVAFTDAVIDMPSEPAG